MRFTQKNHPEFLKRLIFILEKGTFFFAQLCPVVARTWCPLRSERFFLGPKSRFLAEKIQILPYDPNFGQQPVCSPRRDRSFPTLGAIFRLSVPELRSFCQKVLPLPTVRAPLPVTAQTFKNNWRLELNSCRWLSKTTQLSGLFAFSNFQPTLAIEGLLREAAFMICQGKRWYF